MEKTPYEKYLEVEDKILIQPEVTQVYWDSPAKEIVPRNSKWLAWIKEHKKVSLIAGNITC